METQGLVLPILLDPAKKFELGTLIDCRNLAVKLDSQVPELIKDDPYAGDEVEKLPIRSLKYDLKQVRGTKTKQQELGIGFSIILKLPLGLKLNVGSAQYDVKYTTKAESDHYQVTYYLEDYVRRLLPLQSVKDLYNGKPTNGATHIVTEVVYGVNLIANALITTNKVTKMTNKTSAMLGALIIGPIEAAVSAMFKAAMGGDKGGDTKTELDIDASHPHLVAIKDVGDLFKALKDTKLVIAPVKVFCLPIKQFLPDADDVGQITPSVPNIFMEAFNQMFTTVLDFRKGEDARKARTKQNPPETFAYFVARVCQEDRRFRPILTDADCDITKGGMVTHNKWNTEAEYFDRECSEIMKLLDGEGGADNTQVQERIVATLEQFHGRFNLVEFRQDVETYAGKCREQLAAVNADDVDEYTEAQFAASPVGLTKLKAELNGKVYVVLHTDLGSSEDLEDVPSGVLLSAYNLSRRMDVVVALPVCGTPFALELYLADGQGPRLYDKPEEVAFVLEFLCAATGTADGPSCAWYAAIASWSNVPLPLQANDASPALKDLIDEVLQYYKGVRTFPTFITFKEFLNDDKVILEKYVVTLPTGPAVTLRSGAKCLVDLVKGPLIQDVIFAVADFDLRLPEGVLLAIFKNGRLVGTAHDHLDFLFLKDLLNKQPVDLAPIASNNATFYPPRSQYGKELERIFNFSMFQKRLLVPHPGVLKIQPDNLAASLTAAKEVCGAYLTMQGREMGMIAVLTKALIELPGGGSYVNLLESHGWSQSKKKFVVPSAFDEEHRPALRRSFMMFLSNTDPLFMKLFTTVSSLEYTLQERDIRREDPWRDVGAIVLSLQSLRLSGMVDSIVDNAVALLETQGEDSVREENVKKGYMLIQKELVSHSEFYDRVPKDKVRYLQLILALVPPVEFAPGPEEGEGTQPFDWNPESEPVFNLVLKHFVVDAIDWGTDKGRIEVLVNSRMVLPILVELEKKSYPSWHAELRTELEGFQRIDDYDKVVAFLVKVQGIGGLEVNEMDFIWRNHPWVRLVVECLRNGGDTRVEAAFKAIVREERIPPYVPTQVSRLLRHLTFQPDGKIGNRRSVPPGK